MRPSGSTSKIALMIESDGPGGAETVVLTLADGLRARGLDVRPVVLAGGPGWLSGQLTSAGFKVHLPRLKHAVDPVFALELAKWFKAESISLVHAHEFTMAFYAGLAGQVSGVPHLITMHGGREFAKAQRRRFALRLTAERARHLIGVSEDTCEHLAETLRIPRTSITLVPNGVRLVLGDRNRLREELSLTAETRLLVAVGNLYKVKGHRTLISALGLLRNDLALPQWKLVIAGRGEEHDSLLQQIHESDLDDCVKLLGLRNDIPDLLAAADGWVMSSVSEGLPMALLEAMLNGLPIVSTAVGGIPEIVRPGETGWLVPPESPTALAEAIRELLRDSVKAALIGERGKTLVEANYGQDRFIQRHLELYNSQ